MFRFGFFKALKAASVYNKIRSVFFFTKVIPFSLSPPIRIKMGSVCHKENEMYTQHLHRKRYFYFGCILTAKTEVLTYPRTLKMYPKENIVGIRTNYLILPISQKLKKQLKT